MVLIWFHQISWAKIFQFHSWSFLIDSLPEIYARKRVNTLFFGIFHQLIDYYAVLFPVNLELFCHWKKFIKLWKNARFFLKSILLPKAEKLTHRGKRDCLTVLACCGIIKNLKVFGVSYLLAEKLTFNLTSRNLHSLAFPSILIIIITWPKMRKKSKSANFERRPQTPSRKWKWNWKIEKSKKRRRV